MGEGPADGQACPQADFRTERLLGRRSGGNPENHVAVQNGGSVRAATSMNDHAA
jgi:hypothetical protein